jgi:MFS superfamily sulfate permease-like transporter
LTLAAIAIPEQMATARLGGFAPQIGFFAFIAGSVGFAMWGANRLLSCGASMSSAPFPHRCRCRHCRTFPSSAGRGWCR